MEAASTALAVSQEVTFRKSRSVLRAEMSVSRVSVLVVKNCVVWSSGGWLGCACRRAKGCNMIR